MPFRGVCSFFPAPFCLFFLCLSGPLSLSPFRCTKTAHQPPQPDRKHPFFTDGLIVVPFPLSDESGFSARPFGDVGGPS